MSVNKGGRPAHHPGEVKKAAIAVRTAPSLRDALQAAAKEAGRSVTQEVEARLAASFDQDGGRRSPETQQLLNKIAAEIAEIEAEAKAPWHRSRRTAGAVLEMFEKKPQHWIRTDDPDDDELVADAWEQWRAAREKRDEVIRALRGLGVIPKASEGGMFGSSNREAPNYSLFELIKNDDVARAADSESFFNALKKRWRERQVLAKMELPDEIRTGATLLIDRLEELDQEAEAAESKWKNLIQPYFDAVVEGRKLYRDLRYKVYVEAVQRGAAGDMSDYMVGDVS